MHRLSNQTHAHYENYTLTFNVDLMGYSSFYVCLVTNGAKDGVMVHSGWYNTLKGPSLIPQHHLVEIVSYISYLSICARLQSKLLAHMQREQLLPYRVHETCPYSLHMVNMLEQATSVQLNFNSYLCERVALITKKGEIESSSLVLVN